MQITIETLLLLLDTGQENSKNIIFGETQRKVSEGRNNS
jgi:hypothetical protein